jgi:hypothetical protein
MTKDIPPRLLEKANQQQGIIGRKQALAFGMSDKAIRCRLAYGSWRRIYPGVYAIFTGPISRAARLWAVVLYAGPDARLSHETAAELLGISGGESALVHVTIHSSRKVTPPDGVVIHRSSHLGRPWQPYGMPPHTFVEDTILDVVDAAMNLDEVIVLLTTAFARKLASEPHMRRAVAERKKLRWRRELHEIISNGAGGTHSILEYRHDRDVQRAHGLPESVKQASFRKPDGTNGYRDRYYPQHGLVIELDGKRFHPDEQRGRDRERDNQAAVTGSTLRYGWDDVTRRPCETAKQEAEALRNRGWTGSLKPCSATCRAVPGTGDRRWDMTLSGLS